MEQPVNVLGGKLEPCGTQPMTGFFRDGYCNTSPADVGMHTVAATVSDEWLDFSAQRGNDLRGILSGGCKWCLCASRWMESLKAFQQGDVGRNAVPQVNLAATHKRTLDKVPLDDLRAFATDGSAHAAPGSHLDPFRGGPIR